MRLNHAFTEGMRLFLSCIVQAFSGYPAMIVVLKYPAH